MFVFRVKIVEPNEKEEEDEISYGKLYPHIDSSYYYGFAFFRQQKDDTNKRGYLQVGFSKR